MGTEILDIVSRIDEKARWSYSIYRESFLPLVSDFKEILTHIGASPEKRIRSKELKEMSSLDFYPHFSPYFNRDSILKGNLNLDRRFRGVISVGYPKEAIVPSVVYWYEGRLTGSMRHSNAKDRSARQIRPLREWREAFNEFFVLDISITKDS